MNEPFVMTHLPTTATNWRIAATGVRCTVTLEAGELRWQIERAGASLPFIAASLAEITVGDAPMRWAQVRGEVRAHPSGGQELYLEATSVDGGASLQAVVELFGDMPFVRTSAMLQNTSHHPVTVRGAEILQLAFQATMPLTLFHVEQFSWRYRNDFFSQHQVELWPGRAPLDVRMGSFPSHYSAPTSCAWFALRAGQPDRHEPTPREASGIVAGIEFNGKSRLRATTDNGQVVLSSTIDDLAHVLAPGETFALPACFVGCFHGDWDEAGYVTQRFAEAHVSPPMPDERYPWVQYNSWKYGQEINEAQQLAVIDQCVALGIECVVIDLGWARRIGDWRPDPAKFPRGLRPLAERAREHGMRFGVHLALAQMHSEAPAAQSYPEWLIHTGDDYFGAGPICLGHAPCREWLVGEISRLIREEGIDYIIQDGEDMVKRCTRNDHSHAPGDSNYAGSALGIDRVIETLRREHPHVVFENCEDGGCMLTYRMARLYHTSITVDNIATYATRQGIYGGSYPFSPRYSVRYMEDDPTLYTLRSAIFGGPLILMQRITDWNETQMQATRDAIRQYKALRTIVRDAKIIHLLPPQSNVDGLGWGWDAIQAVAPGKSRSVVMVYRAQGGPETAVIRPRGLHPERRYRVQFAEGGHWSESTGAALAEEGIMVPLPQFGAEIIRLEAH